MSGQQVNTSKGDLTGAALPEIGAYYCTNSWPGHSVAFVPDISKQCAVAIAVSAHQETFSLRMN
jgi:hypothetical protein